MSSSYDVIIVGGGPAGTAAAITAARSGRIPGSDSPSVLLLEQGSFPRQKVCGEFVSAESLELLRELLLPSASLLEGALQIAWARLHIVGQAAVALPIAPAAAGIARWDLDHSLWQAARLAGADCRERIAVERVQRQNGGFAVITQAGAFHGRSVIDASGRWSKLNAAYVQARAKPARQPHRVGLKAHFHEPDLVSPWARIATEVYFFRGGYCGVLPMGGGRINVCAMVESARGTSLIQVFRQHPALWERSRGWTQEYEPIATAPLLFRALQADGEGVLHCGDAAGFIDPFAGDGISLALRGGALAAHSLAPFWQGRSSLDQAVAHYRAEYQKRYVRAFRMAAALRHVLNGPPWFLAAIAHALRLPLFARLIVKTTR